MSFKEKVINITKENEKILDERIEKLILDAANKGQWSVKAYRLEVEDVAMLRVEGFNVTRTTSGTNPEFLIRWDVSRYE